MTTWLIVGLLVLVVLLLLFRVYRGRGDDDRSAWMRTRVEWPAGDLENVTWGEATLRAEALLAGFLTDEEQRDLRDRGYLAIPSPGYPGRSYRIYNSGGTGQVAVYEGGARVHRLCVQPCERLPAGDRVLLHKLMIEGDEDRYLQIANRLPPSSPSY